MILRRIYKFLSSAKLALVLLITILACCIVGVTIYRGERAWSLIFNTLWFNGLLVMLVVNVAFCFFPRMWGRKLTLISFGMILFHLSFVAILGGIVYNGFFYFRGTIRLTEGETLPNGVPQSYDVLNYGRFFNFSKLRGETTLVKMHTGYKVDGADKRAAYEIAVGEGILKKQDIIYITKNLEYRGFKYFNDKEGYSLLIIVYDKLGREIYGAHVPLQSLLQKDGSYLYTIGTKQGPGTLSFPPSQLKPFFNMQAVYRPDPKKERSGEVFFALWPLGKGNTGTSHPPIPPSSAGEPSIHSRPEEADAEKEKPFAEWKAKVGERYDAGDYLLEVREVRYWTGMTVRYDPGHPIVLASLCVALAGMLIAFIGRMRRGKNQTGSGQ